MKRYIPGRRKGQSLVEFALLLPIFVLAVVVIFDLGRAVYYYSAIHNAAREGTRYGIVYPKDAAGMEQKAVEYAIGLGLDVTNVKAGSGISQPVGGFANPTVKVIVEYCFTPVTPLVERLLPKKFECGDKRELLLIAKAVMRTEAIPSTPLPYLP
jgi:Flp pilus assembly protein TadG